MFCAYEYRNPERMLRQAYRCFYLLGTQSNDDHACLVLELWRGLHSVSLISRCLLNTEISFILYKLFKLWGMKFYPINPGYEISFLFLFTRRGTQPNYYHACLVLELWRGLYSVSFISHCLLNTEHCFILLKLFFNFLV